ncbi:hypothetical protein DV735_g4903, partial [Chaetothyriales sp. CBS 134920]
MASASESTPLLWHQAYQNPHDQFCLLVGVPPSDRLTAGKNPPVGPKTLYGRATRQYQKARTSYAFVSALSNTLLLSQVIIGAALTALGASESSHILITLFGASNTIIAGLVAYLKSRGQPTRARMYRDDLERVVDEIENSEIMWLGISDNVHGYDEIDIDSKVTVRSEVARLMRLYERAVANNLLNNPDNYMLASGRDSNGTALRSRPSQPAAPDVGDDTPKKADAKSADTKDTAKDTPKDTVKDTPPPAPQEVPSPAPDQAAEGASIATTVTEATSDNPDASPALTDPAPKDKSKQVEKSSEAETSK